MQVKMEKNTNRKYYRIELPAKVSINSNIYTVKDWSLGGFMIVNVQDVFVKDWQGIVKLLLPFDDVEIAVEAEAKVAWAREDRVGFTFVEISTRVKNILKTYLKSSIEGNLGEIDGVLTYVDAPEIPLPTEEPMKPEEEVVFKRNFYTRSAYYWAFGAILVLLASVTLYFSLTKATSTRAVVSVPLVNIDAPFEGQLVSIHVNPGDKVKQGQILAAFDEREVLRAIARQKQTIAVAEAELGEAVVRFADEGKNISLYSSAANHVFAELTADRNATKARLDLASKDLARMKTLLNTGAISKSFYDEKYKSYEEQRNLLRAADERLKLAGVNLASVQQGKYMGNNNTVHGEGAVFNAQISVKSARVQEEQAKLHELMLRLEKTKLVSPCDGEVYVVKSTPGSNIHQGDELFAIQSATADKVSYVLARFTFDDAKGIAPGNTADIFVSSLGTRVSGKVESLGHQALSGTKSSSPDMEISLTEVPVKIALDNNNLNLKNGITVKVDIRTSLTARMGFFL